jgi:hypothetical protein
MSRPIRKFSVVSVALAIHSIAAGRTDGAGARAQRSAKAGAPGKNARRHHEEARAKSGDETSLRNAREKSSGRSTREDDGFAPGQDDAIDRAAAEPASTTARHQSLALPTKRAPNAHCRTDPAAPSPRGTTTLEKSGKATAARADTSIHCATAREHALHPPKIHLRDVESFRMAFGTRLASFIKAGVARLSD